MKKGWQTKTLGEIADVQSGGTPLVSNKAFWNGNLPWYSSGELNDLYTSAPERHVSLLGIESSNAKLFPEGSLLIGMYDTAALKMSILDRAGAFNQAIAGVRPNERIDLVFVLHAINAIRESVLGQRRGVRQKNLSLGKIREIPIPVPPLAEQQRIVGLLDEAFEGLATAKANAEKNLQNARDLFESHLQSVFTQRGNGWVEKPLGEICGFSQGVQVDVKLQSDIRKDQSQVRFLRIIDFTQGNDPERFIDNPGEKFLVCQSDISLVRYGASTGFVCRGLEGAIANNLFRVIPKDGHVSKDFLYWFLKSPAFQDEIKEIMNGAAMPAISFGVINEICIAFLPQRDQLAIVNKLELFAEETQRLARIYERKLAALAELKKSLLHQAFTGEL